MPHSSYLLAFGEFVDRKHASKSTNYEHIAHELEHTDVVSTVISWVLALYKWCVLEVGEIDL